MSTSPSATLPQFQHQPVALNVLLIVITAGFYAPWWLFKQTQVINAHAKGLQIPWPFVHITMALSLVNLVLLFTNIDEFLQHPPPWQPDPAFTLTNTLWSLCLMAWTLLVRGGINLLARVTPDDRHWVSLPLTLLLQLLALVGSAYLQFKINAILADRNRR